MRVVIPVLAAALIAALVYWAPSPFASNAERTVLVVVLDSARADRTSLADPSLETTPYLAQLAERALVFDDHVCASDGANAALASILTGREPHAHGVGDLTVAGRQRLSEQVTTLAEVLQADGFATWGAAALPQLDADLSGLAQGFEVWHAPALGTETGGTPTETLLDTHLPELEALLRESEDVFALAFLADARDPLARPATERARFYRPRLAPFASAEPEVAAALELLDSDPAEALEALDEAFRRRPGHPVSRALELASYDAALGAADAGLGRLLDLLADHDRLDTACIVVVGARGREPNRAQNDPPGDATLLTPWILRPPGGVAAQHVGFETHAIDVAPSLLAVLGLDVELGPVTGTALFVDDAPRPPVRDRIVLFESVQDGSFLALGHGARAWSRAPGIAADAALAQALAGVADRSRGTELVAVHGGAARMSVGLRRAGGPLDAVVVGPEGERSPKKAGAELRLELSEDPGRPTERLKVRGEGVAAPLRLSVQAQGAVEERVWIGATPLERAAIPRIADRRAGDWPTVDGEEPQPVVDIERVQGTTFRVTIQPAKSGERVEALVTTYPPRKPIPVLEVRLPGEAEGEAPEIQPLPGRPDFARVIGTTPCSFLVERRASESLALAVAVAGRQVALSEYRLEGRRYARPGTMDLYLPAPSSGLFAPYAVEPVAGSVPPGTLIVHRAGGGGSSVALSVEQLRFVRRLGGRQ